MTALTIQQIIIDEFTVHVFTDIGDRFVIAVVASSLTTLAEILADIAVFNQPCDRCGGQREMRIWDGKIELAHDTVVAELDHHNGVLSIPRRIHVTTDISGIFDDPVACHPPKALNLEVELVQ